MAALCSIHDALCAVALLKVPTAARFHDAAFGVSRRRGWPGRFRFAPRAFAGGPAGLIYPDFALMIGLFFSRVRSSIAARAFLKASMRSCRRSISAGISRPVFTGVLWQTPVLPQDAPSSE